MDQGPWKPQQPYITQGFEEAKRLYDTQKPEYFPGETYVPFSDASKHGMDQIQSIAATNPAQSAGTSALNDFLSGNGQQLGQIRDMLMANPGQSRDVGSNTATAATSNGGFKNPNVPTDPNAYIGDVMRTIGRDVNQQVDTSYGLSGRTGTSAGAEQARARGIADAAAPYQFGSAEAAQGRTFTAGENLANRNLAASEAASARQAAAAEADLQRKASAQQSDLQRNYAAQENAINRDVTLSQADKDRKLQALSMAPEFAGLAYQGADRLLGVGAMQEGKSGEQLQSQLDKFNFQQQSPQQALADYMAMVTGNYGQAGTNTSNATMSSRSVQPFSQTFGQMAQGVSSLVNPGSGGAANLGLGK